MKPLPIHTDRLILREFRTDDEASIHEYASDPEVTRHIAWGPNDLATTHAVLDAWIEQQDKWPREAVPLAIELKDGGKVIGNTGFSSVDFDTLTGVFGFVLHKDHWGQGYAAEVIEALLEFGFVTLALHRVVAECFSAHEISSHVLERAGMRREGHFLQSARKTDIWCDTYQYALLNNEWCSRPQSMEAKSAGKRPFGG